MPEQRRAQIGPMGGWPAWPDRQVSFRTLTGFFPSSLGALRAEGVEACGRPCPACIRARPPETEAARPLRLFIGTDGGLRTFDLKTPLLADDGFSLGNITLEIWHPILQAVALAELLMQLRCLIEVGERHIRLAAYQLKVPVSREDHLQIPQPIDVPGISVVKTFA